MAGALVVCALAPGSASATLPPGCAQTSGTVTCTFSNTGAEQSFTVPAGVASVHVVVVGEGGFGVNAFSTGFFENIGGSGASVSADLPVTPGTNLYAEVGAPTGSGEPGGAGGVSAGPSFVGGAGGGASDVRLCSSTASSCPQGSSLASRVIVAGGGGGGTSGDDQCNVGGSSGDATPVPVQGGVAVPGDDGVVQGATFEDGHGGGVSAPGAGGAGSSNFIPGGSAGIGAAGGAGGSGDTVFHSGVGETGGGGGGGYFGGGGGADAAPGEPQGGGAGGGGSSFGPTAATFAAAVVPSSNCGGVPTNNPQNAASITISYATVATSLTASPLLFGGISARLTRTDNGQPIAGQTIVFTAGGATLCTATTDANGTASCNSLLALLTAVLNLGYNATFAGNGAYLPSSAHGKLIDLTIGPLVLNARRQAHTEHQLARVMAKLRAMGDQHLLAEIRALEARRHAHH